MDGRQTDGTPHLTIAGELQAHRHVRSTFGATPGRQQARAAGIAVTILITHAAAGCQVGGASSRRGVKYDVCIYRRSRGPPPPRCFGEARRSRGEGGTPARSRPSTLLGTTLSLSKGRSAASAFAELRRTAAALAGGWSGRRRIMHVICFSHNESRSRTHGRNQLMLLRFARGLVHNTRVQHKIGRAHV